jgi:hypothetical protein
MNQRRPPQSTSNPSELAVFRKSCDSNRKHDVLNFAPESSYGHHRLYNRYEGLYDRYESGRCKELRAVCAHKEELGIGNCRRFRELCD